ncbi:AAA family ATPase [Streptomyces sp. MT29]|nr:AAA family ATPase [Streptomyces sp. MT29]
MAQARAGRSGALLLRGEAGIGKTALLDWLAGTAAAPAEGGTTGDKGATGEGETTGDGREVRVLRVTGVEPEADLAFGGLVQLLWPVQDRLNALPEPQAAALRAVLGTGREQRGPDRFLTGLAVLTLLAELAEDGPLLCLVDDAQWLDRATAEALLFAARRLAAEGVAMVLAGREDDGFTAPGIPELTLPRLDFEDSSRLLADRGRAPALHSQIITESAGNPLALIEFDAARSDQPHQHAPLPVADRVSSAFRARIGGLPERTRLMMLIAAAEGRGDLPLLLRASELLGVDLGDLAEAERTGLMYVMDGAVTFRHPLIASATYQARSSPAGSPCTGPWPRPPRTPTAAPGICWRWPPGPTRRRPWSWRRRRTRPGPYGVRGGLRPVRPGRPAHHRPPAAGLLAGRSGRTGARRGSRRAGGPTRPGGG